MLLATRHRRCGHDPSERKADSQTKVLPATHDPPPALGKTADAAFEAVQVGLGEEPDDAHTLVHPGRATALALRMVGFDLPHARRTDGDVLGRRWRVPEGAGERWPMGDQGDEADKRHKRRMWTRKTKKKESWAEVGGGKVCAGAGSAYSQAAICGTLNCQSCRQLVNVPQTSAGPEMRERWRQQPAARPWDVHNARRARHAHQTEPTSERSERPQIAGRVTNRNGWSPKLTERLVVLSVIAGRIFSLEVVSFRSKPLSLPPPIKPPRRPPDLSHFPFSDQCSWT